MGQGCITHPWVFNVYMDGAMKVKMGMEKRGVRFVEEGKEWRFPVLPCEDDLVFLVEEV